MTPRALERELAAIKLDVEALARQLLPRSAPDPNDPQVLLQYLTCEELHRFEAALGDDREAGIAWADVQRRAVARMLTNIDVRALDDRENASLVLVRIPHGEPAIPGRTRLVGYVADQTVPDLWHVESVYRGALPKTMSTAELAAHDPQPWPPKVTR